MTCKHNRPRSRRGLATRAATLTSIAALALTALGCEDYGRLSDRMALSLSEPEVHHEIGFASKSERLQLQLPPPGEGLSHNQFADVYRFVKRFRAESNGRLTVSVPGRNARDAIASSRAFDDVRQALQDAGVDERNVDKVYHGSSKRPGAALRLSYLRPVAVPPECGLWYRDVGHERERVPYPQWGCATQRNLAGMVANARDLQRPQDEDPSSSERRAALWSKYVPPGGAAPKEDATKAKAPTTTGTK